MMWGNLLIDSLCLQHFFPCVFLKLQQPPFFVCIASPPTFQFLCMGGWSMGPGLSQSELLISLSHDPAGANGNGRRSVCMDGGTKTEAGIILHST